MTAWMMWKLQGDAQTAGTFVGAGAELLRNNLYKEQKADPGDK